MEVKFLGTSIGVRRPAPQCPCIGFSYDSPDFMSDYRFGYIPVEGNLFGLIGF